MVRTDKRLRVPQNSSSCRCIFSYTLGYSITTKKVKSEKTAVKLLHVFFLYRFIQQLRHKSITFSKQQRIKNQAVVENKNDRFHS